MTFTVSAFLLKFMKCKILGIGYDWLLWPIAELRSPDRFLIAMMTPFVVRSHNFCFNSLVKITLNEELAFAALVISAIRVDSVELTHLFVLQK